MSNLIGLVGAKRAGKDTVALELAAHGFTRHAFADKVRAALLEVDPTFDVRPSGRRVRLSELVAEHGYEALKEHAAFGVELRGLLQRHGMAMRRVDERVWVESTMRDVDAELALDGRCVVTDVRFENEVEAIKLRGGIIARVRRAEAEAVFDPHESEQLWRRAELVDVELHNDGTLDDLRSVIERTFDFA